MTTQPTIVKCEQQDGQCSLTLQLPEDLHYFQGHFPEQPILAGVVQLNWAVEFARQYLNMSSSDIASVEILKFQQVLPPNTVVTLTLTQKDPLKFLFDYSSAAGNHSSGRIKLAECE